MDGISTSNLVWFASYLNGRKQYIKTNESSDTLKNDIKCEPLLYLLYVNHLPNSSNALFSIMFADDTNFFFLTPVT